MKHRIIWGHKKNWIQLTGCTDQSTLRPPGYPKRGSMSLLPPSTFEALFPYRFPYRPQLDMDYHCTRNMGQWGWISTYFLPNIWGDERPCSSYFDVRQRDRAFFSLQAVSSPCLFIFILESDTRLPSVPSTHQRCWYLPGGFHH